MMALSKHLGSALPRYPIAEVPTTFDDKWTWADLRTSAEAMDPFDYFKFRYYEKWLGGVTQFLVDKGCLTTDELATRTENFPSRQEPGAAEAIDAQVLAYLRMGTAFDATSPTRSSPSATPCGLPTCRPARTRLPGFLRGRVGTVKRVFESDYAYFNHTADGICDPMPNYLV